MYAVFRSGGKQYRAAKGDVLRLEKIEAEEGATVQFDEVLLVGEGSDIKVGSPLVSGTSVSGKVVRHLRAQSDALGIAEQLQVVKSDAVKFLQHGPSAYDLVIIDPPFATPEVVDAIAEGLVQGWLAEEAIVVCERELVRGKSRDVAWPDSLVLEATKHYGQAVVEFLRFVPKTESPQSDDL